MAPAKPLLVEPIWGQASAGGGTSSDCELEYFIQLSGGMTKLSQATRISIGRRLTSSVFGSGATRSPDSVASFFLFAEGDPAVKRNAHPGCFDLSARR
jgi:hypothetical protein